MGTQLAKLRASCSCCRRNEVSGQTRTIRPGFLFEAAANPNHAFAKNVIKTTKYTLLTFLPLNLWEQLHRYANVFFLFIVVLNFMPEVAAFAREVAPLPVVVVLTLTGVKDAWEDYQRYKADTRINSKKCRVFRKFLGEFVQVESRCLWPGDIVRLEVDELIPADILLLHSSDAAGICYVETGNLDGETNLKQRSIVQAMRQHKRSGKKRGREKKQEFDCTSFTQSVEVELPNSDIYRFQGKVLTDRGDSPITLENVILRGCAIRNTKFLYGMVIFAGNETKASLNNQGPRFKRSKLESQINYDIVWSIIILFLMCFMGAVGSGVWLTNFENLYEVPFLSLSASDTVASAGMQAFINFWTFIIILQAVIPLSLYLTAEFAKLAWVTYIQNDVQLYDAENDVPAECKAWNIIEDLGQIQYVFCDKTGTLTENKMVLARCSIGGHDFVLKECEAEDGEQDELFRSQGKLKPLTTLENTPIDSLMPRLASLRLNPDTGRSVSGIDDATLLDYFLVMSVCNSVLVSAQSSDSSAGRSRSRRQSRRQRRKVAEEEVEMDDDEEAEEAAPPSDEELLKAYVAESPDEAALVKSACRLGCKLLHRSERQCDIWLRATGTVRLKVLHVLPFDSERKRMSVLLRLPAAAGGSLLLLTKGADNVILPRVRHPDLSDPLNCELQLLATTKVQLNYYARKGLRTLCFASRHVGEEEYSDWLAEYNRVALSMTDRQAGLSRMADLLERQLRLVGASAIEDRLQDGVPDTLSSLRTAGMSVWVLTGDKQETAMQVAKTASLLRPEQELLRLNESSSREKCALKVDQFLAKIQQQFPAKQQLRQRHMRPAVNEEVALVIDGDALRLCLNEEDGETDGLYDKFRRLAEQCGSVICSRATPNQKAAIVKMMQRQGMRTLAIGDGANDVSMIQTADVGVGISGQEGMQATMAADFCLGRFRFLKRLMLVHGHWCYERLARISLYLLYKNFMYSLLLFWYQVFNGFSGQAPLGQIYQIAFNLVMTSLTPLVMAVLDRHIRSEVLMANPELYADPCNSRSYLPWHFWYNIADSIWQSSVAFFVAYFTIVNSDCDMLSFGDLILGSGCFIATLHVIVEARSLLGLHWFSIIGSPIVAWLLLGVILNSFCVTCLHPDNPYYLIIENMGTAQFWLVQLLAPFLALLPRICFRALTNSLSDSLTAQAMRMQNLPQFRDSHKLPLNVPSNTCTFPEIRSQQQQRANGEKQQQVMQLLQQQNTQQSTPDLRPISASAAANFQELPPQRAAGSSSSSSERRETKHRRSKSTGSVITAVKDDVMILC